MFETHEGNTSSNHGERAKNLGVFIHSIGRPLLEYRWPWLSLKEMRAYRDWRLLATVVHRWRLFCAAGLEPEPGMSKMFFELEAQERRAYAAWLKVKHQRSMDFMTGRRRSAPPWPC